MPTFQTPDPIAVRIETSVGWVRLFATDRTDTVVTVRPRDESSKSDVAAAQHMRVDFRNGTLIVTGTKRFLPVFRGGAADIEVALPARSRLHVSLASATMRADGEYADIKVFGASGDIEIDVVTGRLKASIASGALTVHALQGSAAVTSASGDVTIWDVDGDLKLNSASGSLSVGRLRGKVKARTASGSVAVTAAVRGELSAYTNSGEVAIGVAEGTAARLDIVNGSGVISNTLQASDGPQEGDETVVLEVRGGSGDVDIHRAERHVVMGSPAST